MKENTANNTTENNTKSKKPDTKRVFGVDLGTSNSCVVILEGGKPLVVPNSEGKRTTPSIVGFLKNGDRVVGEAAKRQMVTNKDTVYSIKRFIGSTYDEIEEHISNMNYTIENKNNIPCVKIEDKIYTPQEISAMVIQKMKKTAEDYLGEEVTDVVVTVPAYFKNAQRAATKEAVEIAGLNCLRIINEPTAACLASNLDTEDSKIAAIFDIGGGTGDFTIMDVDSGVFEVLATDGLIEGGDSFDQVIIDWISEEFLKVHPKVDLRKDPMASQRLKEVAEKTKIELSSTTSTEINLPYITVVDNIPQHFVETLTRAKFEQLSYDILERIKKPCINALKKSGKSKEEIDSVILVGGSCRIPIIQDIAKEIFGKEPEKSANLDEIVAVGAAIQGGILSGDFDDILLLDVVSVPYAIETMGQSATVMVSENTTIPTKKSETFSTAVDNQNAVQIRVCNGFRPLFSENSLIGEFTLSGIPSAPRGVPQIEVSFDIDANGILVVSAKDKTTGKEQSITIKDSLSISDSELERMKKEAKDNEESDKKKSEELKSINDAENLKYQCEKMLKENADKISEDDKKSLEDKIKPLEEALKTKDVEIINKTKEELTSTMQEIGTKMYENTQNQGETNTVSDNDDVVDVDFTEVD